MSNEKSAVLNSGETDRERLAHKLRQAREYLELSQDEVGRLVDLPRAAISLIESGQRKVDALELKRFAKIFQLSVSYFTDEAEDEIPQDRSVVFLARAMAELSKQDRDEVARFADFLKSRRNRLGG